eukprot:TRINITY_DN4491_c0_g1_i2.p3 TRINITY_DN4491_c0_g1~~TRINITY_DN4491_c0_g1_i2.p3  ORF type:complete len:156 (-),score=25.85 TRINITY_DN4491_c0_g1_i2:475-942(-)
MARMVLLFLLLAAAGTAVTAAAAARGLSGGRHMHAAPALGQPWRHCRRRVRRRVLFNKVCVPAILKPCVVKDTCAPKPVPLPLLRGGAFKNACGKTFHMSADCKLLPLSARCYKACARPVGKALASAIPGKPVTCATKCVDAEKKQQQKVRGGKK